MAKILLITVIFIFIGQGSAASLKCIICNYTKDCSEPRNYHLPVVEVTQHGMGVLEPVVPKHAALVRVPDNKLKLLCFKGVVENEKGQYSTIRTAVGINKSESNADICNEYNKYIKSIGSSVVTCELCSTNVCNTSYSLLHSPKINYILLLLTWIGQKIYL